MLFVVWNELKQTWNSKQISCSALKLRHNLKSKQNTLSIVAKFKEGFVYFEVA